MLGGPLDVAICGKSDEGAIEDERIVPGLGGGVREEARGVGRAQLGEWLRCRPGSCPRSSAARTGRTLLPQHTGAARHRPAKAEATDEALEEVHEASRVLREGGDKSAETLSILRLRRKAGRPGTQRR